MKRVRSHFGRLLFALTLTASMSLAGAQAAPGQNTNSSATAADDDRILRETRQCVRDADRRYKRCLKLSGRTKSRRVRCRNTHRLESSACSG